MACRQRRAGLARANKTTARAAINPLANSRVSRINHVAQGLRRNVSAKFFDGDWAFNNIEMLVTGRTVRVDDDATGKVGCFVRNFIVAFEPTAFLVVINSKLKVFIPSPHACQRVLARKN